MHLIHLWASFGSYNQRWLNSKNRWKYVCTCKVTKYVPIPGRSPWLAALILKEFNLVKMSKISTRRTKEKYTFSFCPWIFLQKIISTFQEVAITAFWDALRQAALIGPTLLKRCWPWIAWYKLKIKVENKLRACFLILHSIVYLLPEGERLTENNKTIFILTFLTKEV